MYSTAYSLLLFSQMPSQPIRIKSMLLSSSNSYVSGFAVMAYSSGFRCSLFLYFRSPRDLVRLRFPSTRPSWMVLPAFSILSISIYDSGLWSTLISTAFPSLPITHLESPALATYNFDNSLSIITTLEVQPIESSIISSRVCSLSSPFLSPYKICMIGGFYGGCSFRSWASSSYPASSLRSSSTLKKLCLIHSRLSSLSSILLRTSS